jgi:cobalt-zinc-cadmium resistance protein CzcA
MTTLTTVLGLVPLILATGPGSEIQRPLAIVVVFGLITSTVVTLFAVPTFYRWVENKWPRTSEYSVSVGFAGKTDESKGGKYE